MTTVSAAVRSKGKRPYRRQIRNVLIHKPMQREFTFVLIALIMISSLVIGFVIHHTIHSAVYGGGFRFGKVSPYEILSDVSYQLIIRVSCVLFVTLVILGLFALLFLHRVAGPVYRFKQTLVRVNRGDVPDDIRLREGDFFEETAIEINLLLKRLKFEKERMAGLREKAEQLSGDNASAKVAEIRELCTKQFQPIRK
ncbi:MAG: hypothetical protein ACOY3K_07550 [Candidatus Omnitrophota bacterium]